jgi:hypothetical protein
MIMAIVEMNGYTLGWKRLIFNRSFCNRDIVDPLAIKRGGTNSDRRGEWVYAYMLDLTT